MENVILVIHLFLALSIIGLVLLQRSEGGGLGIGGGNTGGLSTAAGTANFLTRATGICAAAFFATSIILGILAGVHSREKTNLADALSQAEAPIEKAIGDAAAGDDISAPLETPEAPPSVPIKN